MSIFGTDGIRGLAGVPPIDVDTVFTIGRAIGKILENPSIVLIAKDTRVSSDELEFALTSGLNSCGIKVISMGVMPTPSLSFFVLKLGASMGVMISASHNQYCDNGLKFFSNEGVKLSREREKLIESFLKDKSKSYTHPIRDKITLNTSFLDETNEKYIDMLIKTFPKNKNLNGIKIVLDVANGATTPVAEKLLTKLGATVFAYNNTPNGTNINNDCGSMHPENIKDKIINHQADIGICLDGDGDRVVICDEKGNAVDGDQLIASLALFFLKSGVIKNKKIVTTTMSSMALEKFLYKHELELIKTEVGERNVINKMEELDCTFGAENSGHFIIKNHIKTSDGLISALQVLSLMVTTSDSISKITNNFIALPKTTKNIYLDREIDNIELEKIKSKFSMTKNLGIIIRKSGTEKGLIRISAEGDDINMINKIIEYIINELHNAKDYASIDILGNLV